MKINDILFNFVPTLQKISTTPRLDVEVLLSNVLQKPRSFLYAYPDFILAKAKLQEFEQLLKRRKLSEPIAYLVGHKEFWGLNFKVNKHTLIPRPETELLVELIFKKFANENNIKLLDLGTGCGAIALAIAHEKPNWQIMATDISKKALKIARINARNLKIENVKILCADWCDFAAKDFNIIISNPPYIKVNDKHLMNLQYEPKCALIAAENGLACIKKIIAQATTKLIPGGILLLEHGFDQACEVRELLITCGFSNVITYRDLANKPRVTLGEFSYL